MNNSVHFSKQRSLKELRMQYLKNLFLGSIMLMLITGCSGLSFHGPLLSVEGIVVLPEPEPQQVIVLAQPQPTVVYWYQTTTACCYVLIDRQWTWHYHYWHHHHHQGRPHYGYAPKSPVPQQYMRPPK